MILTFECIDLWKFVIMDDISSFTYNELPESKFLIPQRVNYVQNGLKREWDGIKEHADVQILIFNTTRNVFVFVKQFRPAVYLSSTKSCAVGGNEKVDTKQWSGSLGITVELCAGIIDKDLPAVEIAREEVLEEYGYNVPVECFQKITSCRNGSQLTGSHVTLFYTEVTDSMKVSSGGGLAQEGELIDVVELSLCETRNLIQQEQFNREFCLLLAVQWFFNIVYPNKTY